MTDRWYKRHRLEWIAETVRIFGFINRAHIRRKFGLSSPQASADLGDFQEANPGVLRYDRSAKTYLAADSMIVHQTHRFLEREP